MSRKFKAPNTLGNKFIAFNLWNASYDSFQKLPSYRLLFTDVKTEIQTTVIFSFFFKVKCGLYH